uniref:Papain-like cysteine peptidase n=1 Tax=viral metagenome TaxID=1070528 RepID=A0A6C0D9G3_9ZZZZ
MNKYLSLGNNCFIKKYLNTIQPGETNFFDYIGSSQWSINELFLNDFANLFNKEDYANMKVLTNYECVTHKHYYLRFLHDLSKNFTDLQFNQFKSKYIRRILRLKKLLSEENKIIFLRTEEHYENRVIYHPDKYVKTELEYLFEFSDIIKNLYPQLDFSIIQISRSENQNFEDKNIIVINNNIKLTWENCTDVISDILQRTSFA